MTARRALLAIDQFAGGRQAVAFAVSMAPPLECNVYVLHLIEFIRGARATLETRGEAAALVNDAVLALQIAGAGASGEYHGAPTHRVDQAIALRAETIGADVIVLGSERRRGFGRLASRGVREQVVRATSLPVLVAPAAMPVRPEGANRVHARRPH